MRIARAVAWTRTGLVTSRTPAVRTALMPIDESGSSTSTAVAIATGAPRGADRHGGGRGRGAREVKLLERALRGEESQAADQHRGDAEPEQDVDDDLAQTQRSRKRTNVSEPAKDRIELTSARWA